MMVAMVQQGFLLGPWLLPGLRKIPLPVEAFPDLYLPLREIYSFGRVMLELKADRRPYGLVD